MHGTTASVGTSGQVPGAATRTTIGDVDPAWRPWLRLIEIAVAEAEDPAWERAAGTAELGGPSPVVGVPVLDGATVRVDPRRVRRLVRELLRTAGQGEEDAARSLAALRSRRLDAVELVRAAIAYDSDAITRLSERAEGVEPAALNVVAQLAAMPLLRACAKALASRVSESWLSGYCPICGAWPTMAELRGLERNRRLRCGRCAADWPIPVLQCAFCAEVRHDRLRALLPEGQEQTRRVDTCESCKGYLKAHSTLQPLSLPALATMDLTTVELDIVAQERGYARPERPGYAIAITLARTAPSARQRETARDE